MIAAALCFRPPRPNFNDDDNDALSVCDTPLYFVGWWTCTSPMSHQWKSSSNVGLVVVIVIRYIKVGIMGACISLCSLLELNEQLNQIFKRAYTIFETFLTS